MNDNVYGPFYEDAVNSDNYIYKMAMYDACNGFIPHNNSVEATNKLIDKTNKRFNLFKRQIQSGETTIDALSKFIAIKNGPFKRKKLTDEQIMEDIIKGSRIPVQENSAKVIDKIKDMLGELESKGINITTADKLITNVDKIKKVKKQNNGDHGNKIV